MKDLTSYVFSFEEMIRGNFLYVDKTEYIWNLIRPSSAGYFFSRPRRFGKSLTLSTLKAIFEGKKDLFKGLAIYDKPYDWKPYPVIHLSFADYAPVNNTIEKLDMYLHRKVREAASQSGVALPEADDSSAAFSGLMGYYKKKKQHVVIPVDEYDKPILDNITNPEVKELLKILKGFYSVLKEYNAQERLLFVTGVSKFCHVSLFSDLNNLTDITMDARYATMLGYTQEEFETYFDDRIELACRQLNMPKEELLPEIKAWYDGYCFHPGSATVYNPVSLAKYFETGAEFNNYWFTTGTPSFLIELVKKTRFDFDSILSRPVSSMAFNAFEIDKLDPLTLLLQTGYLTIKSMVRKFNMPWYWLDFPNREVSFSFNTALLNAYTRKSDNFVVAFCEQLADAMDNGDVKQLRKVMETFFAGISYEIHHKDESNFQNIFFAIFRLLGYYISAESHTSDGRIDAVAETEKYVFIFEFKLDNDQTAVFQIRDKEYYKKYELSRKKIYLIGVTFSTEKGQIADWQTEEV